MALLDIFSKKEKKPAQLIVPEKDDNLAEIRFDQSGVVISVNTKAVEFFSIGEPENLIGKRIHDLINHDEEKPAVPVKADSEKVKDLEKSKDEFISLASHALRAPLTAIRGLISMIKQGDYGPVNKNLEKPLTNISVSSDRLIRLVNDLLNISRARTGKLVYNLTNFPIQDSINKVVTELSPLAKELKIDLVSKTASVSKVQADQIKTNDIIQNLISNALKFTSKGSIELSLVEKEGLITVFVKDTGTGIPEKDQQRLFQRFQQIANATAAQITGTGLGLFLSKMLANKMGGDVWLVESHEGKGSTFAVSLPVVDSAKAKEVKLNITNEQNTLSR